LLWLWEREAFFQSSSEFKNIVD